MLCLALKGSLIYRPTKWESNVSMPLPILEIIMPLFPSYKDSVPVIHGAHLSTCPLSTCISPFMKDPCRFFAFLWGGFFFINMYNFIYGGGFPCCWCLFCLKHVPLKPKLASLKPAILGSQPPKCFWLQAKATTPSYSLCLLSSKAFNTFIQPTLPIFPIMAWTVCVLPRNLFYCLILLN